MAEHEDGGAEVPAAAVAEVVGALSRGIDLDRADLARRLGNQP